MKPRTTVFSRFLIFLVIALPTTFFTASYFNGENGLDTLRNLFSGKTEMATNSPVEPKPADATLVNSTIARLEDELKEKEIRLQKIYEENEALKQDVAKKDKELEELKVQLQKIKSAIGK